MSLELIGNIDVDVQKYESHADKSHDGKTANVTVGWDITEEEAEKIGGSTFRMGVFAGYVGKSGVALHKSFKPSNELVIKHEHLMKFEIQGRDYPLVAKPKVEEVLLDQKRRGATVKLKIPVAHSNKKLRHLLDDCCGGPIGVIFEGLKQPDLPVKGKASVPEGAELEAIEDQLASGEAVVQ